MKHLWCGYIFQKLQWHFLWTWRWCVKMASPILQTFILSGCASTLRLERMI